MTKKIKIKNQIQKKTNLKQKKHKNRRTRKKIQKH